MRSVRQWRDVKADDSLVASIVRRWAVPLPLARALAARDVGLEDADRFLQPRLSHLSDPFRLPDMRPAVDRIQSALAAGERITVFGDYDADGVTSTALLVHVLRGLGARVEGFIPSRIEEGYGFTIAALERCLRGPELPSLLITVDCGVCSGDAVERARGAGIDVVVTDHHDLSGPVAPAVAVVNPKRGADPAAGMLAGVGVAFKLCHALVKDRLGSGGAPAVDLREYLDLVAIGTISDVVPLTGENRILARHGLARLNASPRVGLRALADVSGLRGPMDCYHVGFMLGPRLNAAGRMGDAGVAVDLLLTEDAAHARSLARQLDAANGQRKEVETHIFEAATGEIDTWFDPLQHYGIVVGSTGWHIGTVGIVASRLARRYHRPVVVVGFDEQGNGTGSCRGIEGVSLVEILEQCADSLSSFGGHAMAAGVRLRRGALKAFHCRFNALCGERLAGRDLRPVHYVDAWMRLGDADERLHEGLRKLAPLGEGNPPPLWGVRDVQLVGRPRVVGRKHLKMVVAQGGDQRETIGFNLGDRPLPDGSIDVLFELKENHYNGRRSLQLHVKDFRETCARTRRGASVGAGEQ